MTRAPEGGLETGGSARSWPVGLGQDRGLRTTRRHLMAVCTAIAVLAVCGPVSPAAAAQTQKQNPSPEQLWDAYPLAPDQAGPEPSDPAPTPTAVPSRDAGRPAVQATPAPSDDSGGVPVAVIIVGAVFAVGIAIGAGAFTFGVGIGAGALGRRRQRAAVAQRPAARPAPAAKPAPAPAKAPKRAAAPSRSAPAEATPAWEPPAPPEIEATPAKRFARRRPWPREAAGFWTCEVEWSAGYRKSMFRAMAAPPGQARRRPIAESAPAMWTLMGEPDPPTPQTTEMLRGLLTALADEGWERIEGAGPWYALRFLWRRDGQPRPIAPPTEKGANA